MEQLIGNLLLRHNCVIIPSFGGFVAQRISARIDYTSGTMLPPGKSILFNRQLLNNDGLLINEFARENKVSYNDASKELESVVNQWHSTLKEGGRIEIERVGNLFFDEERNICFEQDRFANLLLESFGLGTVHFVSEEDVRIVEHKISVQEETKSVEEPKIAPALSVKEESVSKINESDTSTATEETNKEKVTPIIPITTPVIEKNRGAKTVPEAEESNPDPKITVPQRRNRAWRYVAAACILPIAFYSVWIPVKTDVLESGMLSFNDFNPFHKRSEGTYEPVKKERSELSVENSDNNLSTEVSELPAGMKVYTYELAADTYIKVLVPEKESVENNDIDTEPIQNESNQSTATFEANSMHYVVGCFSDKANADNLVAKMRANGLDATIVDNKGGLHRVSAGGAISEEAYQTIKLKADAMGLSGWRLR